MGDEADADWEAGLIEAGIEDTRRALSWYCEQCAVEVYQTRCRHCGKTRREKR
jgi:predicted RNA-binding protein with PUA domain